MALDFGLLAFRTGNRINFFCFKSEVWSFVKAVLGN